LFCAALILPQPSPRPSIAQVTDVFDDTAVVQQSAFDEVHELRLRVMQRPRRDEHQVGDALVVAARRVDQVVLFHVQGSNHR
jgi:hypothetical protein